MALQLSYLGWVVFVLTISVGCIPYSATCRNRTRLESAHLHKILPYFQACRLHVACLQVGETLVCRRHYWANLRQSRCTYQMLQIHPTSLALAKPIACILLMEMLQIHSAGYLLLSFIRIMALCEHCSSEPALPINTNTTVPIARQSRCGY